MEIWHLARCDDWENAITAGEYLVSTRGATIDGNGRFVVERTNADPA